MEQLEEHSRLGRVVLELEVETIREIILGSYHINLSNSRR